MHASAAGCCGADPAGAGCAAHRGIPNVPRGRAQGCRAAIVKLKSLPTKSAAYSTASTKQEKRNVATRSAKRTCTMAAGRSEVFRTVPLPSCSSGQTRNGTWGTPGNNTCIQAATRDESGRRTPPLRAVSRAASPLPPMDSFSGGSPGKGVRGTGAAGGCGILPECAPGGVPGWPLRVALLLEKPMKAGDCACSVAV